MSNGISINVTTGEATSVQVAVYPLTSEQIAVQLEAAVDKHADAVAAARNYGRAGVPPSVACLGYAGYANPYQAEAVAFGNWMASLWPACYQIQADVIAGTRSAPTEVELIAELPVMVWPV
jgi:hypothetical protein